jgi:tetratricopeptide (TPR) repeat protein
MRPLTLCLIALTLLSSAAWCDEGHHHTLTEQEIGSIHFATSCPKTTEASFNHAVALLHSFQYEDSSHAFEAIAAQDPACAMAQWGIAMSHYHGLWRNGDMAAGREAWQRAHEIAHTNPKTTAREKSYIDALGEIFPEDGKREDGKDDYARAQAFEQKMGALAATYPEDSEAAIFHALALDVTAPKTDKTFSHQRQCGEILEPIFQKQPHHPGVAHYLIHCYDNPVLAEQGLVAARAYAKIAPASAHANHMPSHIFTRVGSWGESIQSNLRSAELAAEAEKTSKNGEARDQRLHALDYLEYAYLQSGQVKKAKSVLEEMNALPPISGLTLTGNYATEAIPARYTMELANWKAASALPPPSEGTLWAQAITWMAIGVGSARSNQVEPAAQAEQKLAALRDAIAKQGNAYWSSQVEVQRQEVAAWIAEANGKHEDALTQMRSAADLEESMDKDAVTPGAITPAREMLAELLLTGKHFHEAMAEYEAVLKIAPKRFNALFGAASAAEAAGDAGLASKYFHQLVESSVGDERPELAAARKKVVIRAAK